MRDFFQSGNKESATRRFRRTSPVLQATGLSEYELKLASSINNYLAVNQNPSFRRLPGDYFVKFGKLFDMDVLLLLAISLNESSGVATGNTEKNIGRIAHDFRSYRRMGGSGKEEPLSSQLAAAIRAGLKNESSWIVRVMKTYNRILQRISRYRLAM